MHAYEIIVLSVWLLVSRFECYAVAIPPCIFKFSSSVICNNNVADARTFEVGATLKTPTLGVSK